MWKRSSKRTSHKSSTRKAVWNHYHHSRFTVALSLFHTKLNLFILYVSYIFGVEEYNNQSNDGFLVDPDQDLIYTKRKLAKQNESADISTATDTTTSSVITFSTANNFSFPQHGWRINLEKMPLFTKAEMGRFCTFLCSLGWHACLDI